MPYQTSTEGIALLLGADRLHERLLFVADSANLAQNTTNPIMSIHPAGSIDCTSTDGTVRLPASFNGAIYTSGLNNVTTINSSVNVSGTTTLNNITTVNSSLNVSGTTILNHFTAINAPLYNVRR